MGFVDSDALDRRWLLTAHPGYQESSRAEQLTNISTRPPSANQVQCLAGIVPPSFISTQ